MACGDCVYRVKVKWGKDIRFACLHGYYFRDLLANNNNGIDGEVLMHRIGFGVKAIFDRVASGPCPKFTNTPGY